MDDADREEDIHILLRWASRETGDKRSWTGV